MSTVTVRPGDLIVLDPSDQRVVVFDWDAENLAATVTITSVFTLASVSGSGGMTKDNASVLSGNRKTQVRLLATTATVGDRYTLSNTVTTNETPAQIKEQSVNLLVQNK